MISKCYVRHVTSIGMIRKIEFAVENEKESELSSCVLMELNFILRACVSGHSMG